MPFRQAVVQTGGEPRLEQLKQQAEEATGRVTCTKNNSLVLSSRNYPSLLNCPRKTIEVGHLQRRSNPLNAPRRSYDYRTRKHVPHSLRKKLFFLSSKLWAWGSTSPHLPRLRWAWLQTEQQRHSIRRINFSLRIGCVTTHQPEYQHLANGNVCVLGS